MLIPKVAIRSAYCNGVVEIYFLSNSFSNSVTQDVVHKLPYTEARPNTPCEAVLDLRRDARVARFPVEFTIPYTRHHNPLSI